MILVEIGQLTQWSFWIMIIEKKSQKWSSNLPDARETMPIPGTHNIGPMDIA